MTKNVTQRKRGFVRICPHLSNAPMRSLHRTKRHPFFFVQKQYDRSFLCKDSNEKKRLGMLCAFYRDNKPRGELSRRDFLESGEGSLRFSINKADHGSEGSPARSVSFAKATSPMRRRLGKSATPVFRKGLSRCDFGCIAKNKTENANPLTCRSGGFFCALQGKPGSRQ